MKKKVVITGAAGLIGSEAVQYFDKKGYQIFGFDNNARQKYFGQEASTYSTLQHLNSTCSNYTHSRVDVSSRGDVMWEMEEIRPDIVIHCAAQPSHDRASNMPFEDFDVNALGTLNMLEATRSYSPHAAFVHMSTNKVYGEWPNKFDMVETETRYDVNFNFNGIVSTHEIDETMSVDNTLHSVFGASKVAADIMAQEYGKYYGLNVGIFRGGCLTGPMHQAVELHGFLSYIVKCAVQDREYTIYGYKGKQVRDQIHSYDVVTAMDAFVTNPRAGEVYNIGGGRQNSASILEVIDILKRNHGLSLKTKYVDQPRKGDHKWYISDTSKFQKHYPTWKLTRFLPKIIDELVNSYQKK